MILYKNKRLVIPAGLSPNINHQSVEIKNENKYVSITSNGTEIVTFDPEHYTGLGIVQINTEVPAAAIQQSTSVSISDNGNYSVFPDEGYVGISEVSVNVNVQPKLQLKTVDSSTSAQTVTYDPGYAGLGAVTVNPYTVQHKASEDVFTYVSSDSRGALVIVKPDNNYDALEYFQYRKATILGTKTFDASTGNQTYVTNTANTYVKGINKIVINGLDLDSCYTLAASI